MKPITFSSIANSRWMSWLVVVLRAVGSAKAQQQISPNRFDSQPGAAQRRPTVPRLSPADPR